MFLFHHIPRFKLIKFFVDVASVYNDVTKENKTFKLFSSGHKYQEAKIEEISSGMKSVNLDLCLESALSEPVKTNISENINFSDKLFYIYTSGTTGLPKAAIIRHSR